MPPKVTITSDEQTHVLLAVIEGINASIEALVTSIDSKLGAAVDLTAIEAELTLLNSQMTLLRADITDLMTVVGEFTSPLPNTIATADALRQRLLGGAFQIT